MTPSEFFNTYAQAAIDTQVNSGVPASITLAQAALESGWGKSTLTLEANNFFGIKEQKNDEWNGEFITMKTREVLNGVSTYIYSKFRKYRNAAESFKDHANFLIKNKRYSDLFKINLNDPYYYINWANGLQKAGYATATSYGSTLVNMINKYNLTQYDKKAIQKKKIMVFAGFALILIVITMATILLIRTKK